MKNVAVVIEAANNIGYHILIKLTKCYNGSIYFTTADKLIGYKILDELKASGVDINYNQLDVTDVVSIVKFRHDFQDVEKGIDLLINNTDYKPNKKTVLRAERVRKLLNVNFYGNINLANILYPLLKENGRVVNVSGPASLLAVIPKEELRQRISNSALDEDGLAAVMQEYEAAVYKGTVVTEGWGDNDYAICKIALNALTFSQQRKWNSKGIVINCVNPGDISSKEERRDTKVFEEGANAIVYLAMEAPLHVEGNFVWSNYSVVEWDSEPFVEVTRV